MNSRKAENVRYRTDFWGSIGIDPPLNEFEVDYLKKRFADDNNNAGSRGPYSLAADGTPAHNAMIQASDGEAEPPTSSPAHTIPDGFCDWTPIEDGTALELDDVEIYDDLTAWARYLIDTFLRPGATLQRDLAHRTPGWEYPAELDFFTFDHLCNGELDAQGDDSSDRWRLVVRDNNLSIQDGPVSFPHETLLWPSLETTDLQREPEPLAAERNVNVPVAQLLVVRADGDAMAWTAASPNTFDGIFRGASNHQTLLELLDNPTLRVPPGTPIVRLDLTAQFPAMLFALYGPDPSPALPVGTVRRIYRDSEPYFGEREQLLKLVETSVDLYLTFAEQCGVIIQRTPPSQ